MTHARVGRQIKKDIAKVLKEETKLTFIERQVILVLFQTALKKLSLMTGSWKTSLGGILAAIGLSMTAMTDPTIKLIGTILAAVGAFLTGQSARDNKKTSEEVGAK